MATRPSVRFYIDSTHYIRHPGLKALPCSSLQCALTYSIISILSLQKQKNLRKTEEYIGWLVGWLVVLINSQGIIFFYINHLLFIIYHHSVW